MAEFALEIDGEGYAGKTASARNQMEALHIMGGSSALMAVLRGDVSDMGIVTALVASLPIDSVRQLETLLVKGCVTRESDTAPVAVNLFGDKIQNYYLLIGKVAIENLQGFWLLHRQTGAPETVEQS